MYGDAGAAFQLQHPALPLWHGMLTNGWVSPELLWLVCVLPCSRRLHFFEDLHHASAHARVQQEREGPGQWHTSSGGCEWVTSNGMSSCDPTSLLGPTSLQVLKHWLSMYRQQELDHDHSGCLRVYRHTDVVQWSE